MIIAGPTPSNDIRPVASGSPAMKSMIQKYTFIQGLCNFATLPTTVETAAKVWAVSWLDSSVPGTTAPIRLLKVNLYFLPI